MKEQKDKLYEDVQIAVTAVETEFANVEEADHEEFHRLEGVINENLRLFKDNDVDENLV